MPVRVAFIGAGGIANAHMRVLSQITDAQIVAYSDPVEGRAANAAATFGGKAYVDHVQMLDAEKPDAVYVCVPPHAHVGQEQDVVSRGIHLFVEKPIANSLETAAKIAEEVDRAGVISSVGYHWRYMRFTDLARQQLEGKTVGMVLGYWMGGMPGVDWWRRIDQSGGQFVEQTTHIVDLARYLVGDVAEVYSAMSTRALGNVENFSVTDVGVVALKFSNGAVGSISNTCLLNGIGYTVGLHLITPDCIVEVNSGDLRTVEAGAEQTVRGGNNAYLEEDQVFIRAIATGDASAIRSPYADAVKTLAVTLAANTSHDTGRAVVLDE